MKKLALASVAVLGFASASHAYMTDTVNKSGFYVGVNGGYTYSKSKVQTGANTKNVKLRGGLGGVHLGYQHDFGRTVGGIELATEFTKVHKKFSRFGTVGGIATTFNDKLTRKNDYTASLRFGYKVAPCWVAGVSLGYARNNYTFRINPTRAAGQPVLNSTKNKLKHNGFTPGVYVEKLLNRHFMVGAEYSYGIFKKKSFTNQSTGVKVTNKPQTHDFKVRLGYKF